MQNQILKFTPPDVGFPFPDVEPGLDCRPGEKMHEYHFMLDQGTFDDLAEAGRKGIGITGGSVPGLVAQILRWFYSFLEVKHFSENERKTAYQFIDGNPGEDRRSVKVIIPKRLYNRIKLLHKDLDAFSMAQIVREVIHYFLLLLAKLRQGLKDFLRRFDVFWAEVKEWFREEKRPIRRVRPPIWGPPLLRTIYSDQFSPVKILLC